MLMAYVDGVYKIMGTYISGATLSALSTNAGCSSKDEHFRV